MVSYKVTGFFNVGVDRCGKYKKRVCYKALNIKE
jgi:hypothetical protein